MGKLRLLKYENTSFIFVYTYAVSGLYKDDRKKTIYLPASVAEELRSEAKRQDRPISWLIRRAWILAKKEIGKTRVPEGIGRPTKNPEK